MSDPVHVEAGRALHRHRVGVLRPVREAELEQRAVSDYDTALGRDTALGLAGDLDGEVAG